MNSAKLMAWENKGSLSFVEQLAHHTWPAHLSALQRPRWLGKGRQDFLHNQACSFSAGKVTLPNLSGARTSGRQPPALSSAPRSPLTQGGFLRVTQRRVAALLGPLGRPELLQWGVVMHLVF